MAKTQKIDPTFGEPAVRPEPDTTFEERTRVERPYHVGDTDAKDPYGDQRPVVDAPRVRDGVLDKSVGTPVGEVKEESTEGHESPSREDGHVTAIDGTRIDTTEDGKSMSSEEARKAALARNKEQEAKKPGDKQTEVERMTEEHKDFEDKPSETEEAQRTEAQEQAKGVNTGARKQSH